jgi:GT2 family glycosyltransferase
MLRMKKRKDYPLISIITVNYNHSDVTCDLIDSLNNITYPNIEIIVIDNCSPNDDPTQIKRKFPNIILVENPINYGFAAGNNSGLMRARGKYVLLLNNDTIVKEDFIEPLLEKFESDPNIGAVSPKIRYFHTPDTIQYAGYTPIDPRTMRNFAIGFNEVDKGQHDHDRETAYAHGAAMMVPMEIVKEIGMMSYIFFLYYEEADWCARIKNAGYKMYYVHNSLIYHKESISTGKLSAMKIYYQNRNRLVFMRRNISGKDFYIGILYQLLIAIPKNAFKFLIKGKFQLFHAFNRAIGWHLRNLFNKEIHENPML